MFEIKTIWPIFPASPMMANRLRTKPEIIGAEKVKQMSRT